MMANYAIVTDGVVTNVIAWDGETAWTEPAGATVVQSDSAMIGGTYENGVFTSPPSTEA